MTILATLPKPIYEKPRRKARLPQCNKSNRLMRRYVAEKTRRAL